MCLRCADPLSEGLASRQVGYGVSGCGAAKITFTWGAVDKARHSSNHRFTRRKTQSQIAFIQRRELLSNVSFGGAPWKGGAFQWVRVPPGEMLQPEATGATVEVTKQLKPLV